MGDIADDILGWMEDALGDYNGLYDDAWEDGFYPRKKIPTCKFCGKSPLRWRQVCGNWVLHERDGKYHDCPSHPLPLNVLKDILEQQRRKRQQTMSEWDDFRDTIVKPSLPLTFDAVSGKVSVRQLLPIPSWDEFFMRHVYLAASKSKDPRTKIGAVLVKNGIIISEGFNGFARGVQDLPERYLDRKTKYKFVVHGEANSIQNSARNGICTTASVLYTNGIPCDSCGKTIIQAGISEVVIHKQWPETLSEVWRESVEITKIMFREAAVNIRVLDCHLKLQGLVDGKIIDV